MSAVPSTRSLRRVRSRAFAIEAALLRASVGALEADRFVCKHCHRTPLTGERVYLYGGRHGTEVVCELCRPQRVAAPDSSVLVRSPETSSVTPLGKRRDE
jgi:hypothetical protein